MKQNQQAGCSTAYFSTNGWQILSTAVNLIRPATLSCFFLMHFIYIHIQYQSKVWTHYIFFFEWRQFEGETGETGEEKGKTCLKLPDWCPDLFVFYFLRQKSTGCKAWISFHQISFPCRTSNPFFLARCTPLSLGPVFTTRWALLFAMILNYVKSCLIVVVLLVQMCPSPISNTYLLQRNIYLLHRADWMGLLGHSQHHWSFLLFFL